MIRRRPKVMVNAFRRLFGAKPEPAEPQRPEALPGFALTPLPAEHGLVLRWRRHTGPFGPFRLADESRTFAEIRRGPRGTRIAFTAGATWSLPARWTGSVRLLRGDATEPVVEYHAGTWGDGRIERRAGPALRWRRTGLGTVGNIETEDGLVWIECASEGFMRPAVTVLLHEVVRNAPDRDALVLLTGVLPEIARRERAH